MTAPSVSGAAVERARLIRPSHLRARARRTIGTMAPRVPRAEVARAPLARPEFLRARATQTIGTTELRGVPRAQQILLAPQDRR